MRLQSLRALVAAVEEGSLRAAARRVGLSQPALTKLVRELESELAAPLLTRSTSGVMPTAQGRVMVARASTLLRELDDTVEEIGQMSGRMVGDLHISAVPAALWLLLPETLRTFSREFADIRLFVNEELYVAQLQSLRRGEADLVLGPVPAQLPPGEFQVLPLLAVPMVVVVRKGSPWARVHRLADLSRARWVYTSMAGSTGYARDLFEQHGLSPPVPAAVVNSTLGLLALLMGDDVVGLLPQPLAEHPLAQAHVVSIDVPEAPLVLSLGAISRHNQNTRPVVRHFLRHLERAAHAAVGPHRGL